MFSTMDLDNLKPDSPSGYQCGADNVRANNLWITFYAKKYSMISMMNRRNLEKVVFS
jgi:hypothetical protein